MTTTVRVGDRVSLPNGWTGFWTSAHERECRAFMLSGDVTIMCEMCPRIDEGEAVWFLRSDGTALCRWCRGGIEAKHLQDMRPDPNALVSCICGESLDRAPTVGVWTMAGIACEYRNCLHCKSTRAWMPADVVEGRTCVLLAEPEDTSYQAILSSLLDALMSVPPTARSIIVRDGVVLARAYEAPTPGAPHNRSLAWKVCEPLREVPSVP